MAKVISIDTQLHGYRQGHELLAFSARLTKNDQSTVDQLSDVAGPLRPGEVFAPYLSAYPLPSGTHFVLARTWQDKTVARAGCVRTLSLLIPSSFWAGAEDMRSFLALLDPNHFPTVAERVEITELEQAASPFNSTFEASELVEALFLEEQKPVAIFDAADAEQIAIRILSALWPAYRLRFALSTFALSPRKIEGRYFDLIFAPKDARPKFADWPGRRIDGRASNAPRHRWTSKIVDRVFNQAHPCLLDPRELSQISSTETSTSAALRITLLWSELLDKLDRSPTAALGLLDIASSRMALDSNAIRELKPTLAAAAERAVDALSPAEAWDFLGAMARKIHGGGLASEMQAVAAATGRLAKTSPNGALTLLSQSDPIGAIEALVPEIANGIAENFDHSAEKMLLDASPDTLASLLTASGSLARLFVTKPCLLDRLGNVLKIIEKRHFEAIKATVLPLLSEDYQLPAAAPILASLSVQDLLHEVIHLANTNGFRAQTFIGPIVERARNLDVTLDLRHKILSYPATDLRDHFICKTLTSAVADVSWLLQEQRLSSHTADTFLLTLLEDANRDQLNALFHSGPIAQQILSRLPSEGDDLLRFALREIELPTTVQLRIVFNLISRSESHERIELAMLGLAKVLPAGIPSVEIAEISSLLGIVGDSLDGNWAVKIGLNPSVSTAIINRNLLAFDSANHPARARLVQAVDNIATAIQSRRPLDLDVNGARACARLFMSATELNSRGLLRIFERLLPQLMRAKTVPISSMIAAIFPVVYNGLPNHDSVSDLLSLFPFFTVDLRNAARTELVYSFVNSTVWAPGDLALAALATGETKKILEEVAKSVKGRAYLDRVAADLNNLPPDSRDHMATAISKHSTRKRR